MNSPSFVPPRSRKHRSAFTILELLVSMAVLVMLVALIAQLLNNAEAVIGMKNKHMDADSQARALFDRMAIDIAQMVKRPDVDCFLKDDANTFTQGGANPAGNDQLAFFSQGPGYFSYSGSQSSVSLVGYRVNTKSSQLERFGCGLLWNGVSDSSVPEETPMVFLPVKISDKWPNATSMDAGDNANYELAGPQIFRLEYYYVLKGQMIAGTFYPSILSNIPWDKRDPGPKHTSVSGLQDVAAIGVVIAVADPKSQLLVSAKSLAELQGKMKDFSPSMGAPGDLEAQWQTAIDNSKDLPRFAASGIRIYRRWFYLSSCAPLNQ